MVEFEGIGIEVSDLEVRVVSRWGPLRARVASAPTLEDCLRLALCQVPASSVPSRAMLALPCGMPASVRDGLLLAVSTPKSSEREIEAATVCTSPHALAVAAEAATAISVVIDPVASSIGVCSSSGPSFRDQDLVRPIAGREAREIALAVRCLLKNKPAELARTLLRRVVIGGDPVELDRIGRPSLVREFKPLGAQLQFYSDPFGVARGARHLAETADLPRLGSKDESRSKAATTTPIPTSSSSP